MLQTRELVPVGEAELRTEMEGWGVLCDGTERALAQANLSHAGQPRDNGESYLEQHIYPAALDIMRYYIEQGSPLGIVRAGGKLILLHDTVEDDPNYSIEQCRRDFPGATAERVNLLTRPDDETREANVRRIWFGDHIAKNGKGAEFLTNLQASIDMLPYKPDKMQRYIDQARTLYIPLLETVPDQIYARRIGQTVLVAEERLRTAA